VTIDGLGDLVSLVHSQRLLILGIAISLIGGSLLQSGRQHPHPRRSLVKARDVIHPVFAAAIIGGTIIIITGAVSHELVYVAVDGGSSAPNTLTVGNATTETVAINATALPFTYRLVSTDGMTITNSTRNASTITAEVHIPGPTTSGAYETNIAIYRYPAVLPLGLVETIHSIHPAVAAGTTMGLMFLPFFLAYALLFDGNTPLRTSQTRWRQKLWRRFR
jgi:signal peptidase